MIGVRRAAHVLLHAQGHGPGFPWHTRCAGLELGISQGHDCRKPWLLAHDSCDMALARQVLGEHRIPRTDPLDGSIPARDFYGAVKILKREFSPKAMNPLSPTPRPESHLMLSPIHPPYGSGIGGGEVALRSAGTAGIYRGG
jgi:hypothetical protein